jgi:hypothetical protein
VAHGGENALTFLPWRGREEKGEGAGEKIGTERGAVQAIKLREEGQDGAVVELGGGRQRWERVHANRVREEDNEEERRKD